MKSELNRLVAAVLSLLMIALPGTLSAGERRGAEIAVTCRDGRTVSGELIAVKRDSLLLLSPAGRDESVEVADIASVTVFKKPRKGEGLLFGLLIGAAVGGLAALAKAGRSQIGQEYLPLYAVYYGVPCALAGLLIGGVVGANASGQRNIVLSGLPESTIKARLKELDRLARRRSAN